jgi:hypothetical protein
MEAVRLKSSSVGLSDRKLRRHEVGIPGIVDIGAKPKKAWFDFWLTLLYSVLPVGFDLRRYVVLPQVTQTLPYTSEAACFPADS